MSEKPYKRTIFIVDPKFQFKFSIMMCSLVFISSLFYPLIFLQIIDSLANQFPSASTEIATLREQTMKLVVLWQIAFTAFTFICCILFTHKIAGPLYKLKRHLEALRGGIFGTKLYFRNGDYFHDLADDVNETIKSFQERFKDDSVYISEVTTYLNNLKMSIPDDKKVVVDEIVSKLSEIEDSFSQVIEE